MTDRPADMTVIDRPLAIEPGIRHPRTEAEAQVLVQERAVHCPACLSPLVICALVPEDCSECADVEQLAADLNSVVYRLKQRGDLVALLTVEEVVRSLLLRRG